MVSASFISLMKSRITQEMGLWEEGFIDCLTEGGKTCALFMVPFPGWNFGPLQWRMRARQDACMCFSLLLTAGVGGWAASGSCRLQFPTMMGRTLTCELNKHCLP